jgi:hypothetical protein
MCRVSACYCVRRAKQALCTLWVDFGSGSYIKDQSNLYYESLRTHCRVAPHTSPLAFGAVLQKSRWRSRGCVPDAADLRDRIQEWVGEESPNDDDVKRRLAYVADICMHR